jgi:hypothetical protein
MNSYSPESLEENAIQSGSSLMNAAHFQEGWYQEMKYPLQREKSFEAVNGKKIKIVEVYGDKPVDELLKAFSEYISNLLGDMA